MAQENQHIRFFVYHSGRRTATCATTAAEFTALGVAQVLVKNYIPACPPAQLKYYPKMARVFAGLSCEVYRLMMCVKTLATNWFHAICSGCTGRANHTMVQMLFMCL